MRQTTHLTTTFEDSWSFFFTCNPQGAIPTAQIVSIIGGAAQPIHVHSFLSRAIIVVIGVGVGEQGSRVTLFIIHCTVVFEENQGVVLRTGEGCVLDKTGENGLGELGKSDNYIYNACPPGCKGVVMSFLCPIGSYIHTYIHTYIHIDPLYMHASLVASQILLWANPPSSWKMDPNFRASFAR